MPRPPLDSDSSPATDLSRRRFLADTGAAALAFYRPEAGARARRRRQLEGQHRPDRLRRARHLDRRSVQEARRLRRRRAARLLPGPRRRRRRQVRRARRGGASPGCPATSGCSSSKLDAVAIETPALLPPDAGGRGRRRPASTSTSPSRSPSTCRAARPSRRAARRRPRRSCASSSTSRRGPNEFYIEARQARPRRRDRRVRVRRVHLPRRGSVAGEGATA